MLDKIKTFIENASARPAFDPSEFNDPVAEKTGWNPLKRGGTNIRTHVLKEINPNRIQYKMSAVMRIFSLLFIVVGIGAAWFISSAEPSSQAGNGAGSPWFALLFLAAFSGGGAFMFIRGNKPIVFDKLNGFYWKGKKEPNVSMMEEEMKDACRLSSIHAIQVLRERVQGDKKSYYSYEINLVKKNGERLNVVDYGKHQHIQSDAKLISEFLGKPVWDAS